MENPKRGEATSWSFHVDFGEVRVPTFKQLLAQNLSFIMGAGGGGEEPE